MNRQECPGSEEWRDFVLGKLSAPRLDELEAHLEVCAECLAAAQEIELGDDLLVSWLKQPADGSFVQEVECEQALGSVRALASLGVDDTDASATATVVDLKALRDYQLLEVLGEGGMGTVYKARHGRLGRFVALKVLKSERSTSAAAFARFDREMKAIGRLDHENIVQPLDAGEVDGVRFLAMQLIDGSTVSSIARRYGQLPIPEACEIVRQAACGIHHAHQNGLVHRDLKPSNLLLTRSGTIKVADLGLALLEAEEPHEELTAAGQVMGTLDYLAPEQARDTRSVDHRADIYSLGCTLFRLLAGKPPFSRGKTPAEKLLAHQTEKVPELSDQRSDIPGGLANLVRRMLAKSPHDRPTDAEHLADELRTYASGADLVSIQSESRRDSSTTCTSRRLGALDSVPYRRWVPMTTLAILVACAAIALHWFSGTDSVKAPDAKNVVQGDAVGGVDIEELLLSRTWTRKEWVNNERVPPDYVFSFREDGTCDGRHSGGGRSVWRTWELRRTRLIFSGEDEMIFEPKTGTFVGDFAKRRFELAPVDTPAGAGDDSN